MSDAQVGAGAAQREPEPAEADPTSAGAVAGGNAHHPAAHGGGLFGLALGALGIVFGDIGTSPQPS